MKSIKHSLIIILLSIILCTSFAACDFENTSSNGEKEKETECNHKWNDATCTEFKTCSVCGETDGDELGHTTEQGVCSRCNEFIGTATWDLSEFVDEFDNPTGEKYLRTIATGQFSNSATTDSELIAGLIVTEDYIVIRLLEYGSYLVKCSYGHDDYDVIMLDANGYKHYLSGTMYAGTSHIGFSSNDRKKILSALKESGDISFYIEDVEYSTTNYLFTIETSNFSVLYNQL